MLVAMVPIVPMASAELTRTGVVVNNDDVTGDEDWDVGGDPQAETPTGEYEQVMIVDGPADSVSSGYDVKLYWDKVQSWDGVKGLLNTTEVDDDGGYEIWFEIPETVKGTHNIWITATDQSTTIRFEMQVYSDVDLSSDSGLVDSNIYVDMWSYAKNKDAAILFVADDGAGDIVDVADWNSVTETDVVIHTVTAAEDAANEDTFAIVYGLKTPITTAAIIYHEGAESGRFDGTTFTVPNPGLVDIVPAGCSWVESTNTLTLEFEVTSFVAGDEISITYTASIAAVAGESTGDTGVIDESDDGTADNGIIIPGTFEILAASTDTATDDDSDGKLYDAHGLKIGSVNYVTGEWEFDNQDATAGDELTGTLTLSYEYADDITNYVYILSSNGVTNDLGSWENKRVNVPNAVEGDYWICGLDGNGAYANSSFEIGAIITLSETEGPVGSKVEVEGAGFEPGDTITVTTDGTIATHIIDSEDDPDGPDKDVVDNDGEFVFEIIIPQTDDDDEKFAIMCSDASGNSASVKYKVTALAKTSVNPDFGPQGSTVTISGVNFPEVKDTKVEIWLTGGTPPITDALVDTVKTDADGTFEDEITVPTENDDSYKLDARVKTDDDGVFSISDNVDFRIGTILILMSKDESVVGDKIVLTGNGFTDNDEWNATFGGITIFTEETTSATGLLKVDGETPTFFVPQVDPGVYTILVWDVDAEITVEVDFTVTANTYLEMDPAESPNEYNVTLSGYNWPEVDGALNTVDEIDFLLWNATDDWDMDVRQMKHDGSKTSETAVLNGTGFFNDAYWVVPDDEELSKGTYTVNATIETSNDQSYIVQLQFVVGDVHMSIAPRKSTFRIGDTVSFLIEHSFGNSDTGKIKSGKIKIYDPSGNLYWTTDALDEWTKTGEWYTAQYSSQTASTNPMVLLDDAPLGAWSYKWYENTGSGALTGDDDLLAEGTFTVAASAADVIGEQVADLNNQITDLASQLTDVTSEFDDVRSDIANVAAVAQQAVAAAQQAAEAVQTVAQTANQANTAAQNAADAANAAKDAANGLTTLVYGAIGAALVAALAAIVSLMQISRRIAG
jgi:chaperonin cofactor prefoldin